jgi:hypothetical protein
LVQSEFRRPIGWGINAEGVIFYFELAVPDSAEVQVARPEETSDETPHHELLH